MFVTSSSNAQGTSCWAMHLPAEYRDAEYDIVKGDDNYNDDECPDNDDDHHLRQQEGYNIVLKMMVMMMVLKMVIIMRMARKGITGIGKK